MALPQAEGNQHKRQAKKEEEKENNKKKKKKKNRERKFSMRQLAYFST
jgi:hypothetical protein